ncbi:MAG: radical SAM family heme chaperone HemW [Anaerolineaceae bacterium]
MESHSIYIHIPFCVRRCLYCDFNTYAGMEESMPVYVDALCREVELVGGNLTQPLEAHTVYFGGGTPSLLQTGQVEKILNTLIRVFNISNQVEITLEANPGTIDLEYLTRIRKLGINRLSLGAQSAVPAELELLGRIHSVEDVTQAFTDARKAGFDNLNLDFIYGLPSQTMSDWQKSLDFAMEKNPEHLSLYALTLEDATPLAKAILSGRLTQPDDDLAADFYERAMDCLEKVGYQQYEISNWAAIRKGELKACLHNLQYWRNQPYLGFGAGAHGYSTKYRTANVTTIQDYIERIKMGSRELFPFSPENETRLNIDERTEMQEAMMIGLRLTIEGIARSRYSLRYNQDFHFLFKKQIDLLISQGLLEWQDDSTETLRLTRRGRLLGNQVFMQFVGE